MFIQKWVTHSLLHPLMPLPLLLNTRDTDGECRGVRGKGHKDWPTTFSSVSHDDIL